MPDKPFDRSRELFELLAGGKKIHLRGLAREHHMPGPSHSSDWVDALTFAAQAMSAPVAGLPSKVISVDNDVQPGKSEQLCGQLYGGGISRLDQEPLLRCPNCGECATSLAGGQPLYTRDVPETGGKTHKGSLPPCPVQGVEVPFMLYTVDPCGCKVSQWWASAFSAERASRVSGNKPRAVQPMPESERAARLARLEGNLTKLYGAQGMAGDSETKKDVDYWIVVVIDQIQRLCPGAHNLAAPRALDGEVAKWAGKNQLQTPTVVPKAGDAVYMKPDGTYTTDPTGGKPAGTVTGQLLGWPPAKDVDFKAQLMGEFVSEFAGETGYAPGYKPPPGFKKAGENQIETDSLVCSYSVVGYPKVLVRWSDKSEKVYTTVTCIKEDLSALMNSVSAVERGRGKALGRVVAHIEMALLKMGQELQKAKKPVDMLGEVTDAILNSFGLPPAVYKGEFDVGAKISKPLLNEMWKQAFPGVKVPNVEFSPTDKVPPPHVTPPKPKLQTLPVEEAGINFFGAKAEEKEAYVNALKKIVTGAIKQSEYPRNLLEAVLSHFSVNKGFMTSLVRQVVLDGYGYGDSVTLINHCSAIQKDIERYLNKQVNELQHCSRLLLQGFVQHVEVQAGGDFAVLVQQQAAGPVQAPAPAEPARTNRHVKKRRTIRHLGD